MPIIFVFILVLYGFEKLLFRFQEKFTFIVIYYHWHVPRF